MRPRKSTAILVTAWLATFVLYLFVKPAEPSTSGPQWPSLVSVVGLGMITVGLLRRKRLALLVVLAFQVLGAGWAVYDIFDALLGNSEPPLVGFDLWVLVVASSCKRGVAVIQLAVINLIC